ncbi:MAG: hypothetical protein GY884_22190 [Proteobacteria bacterium]|nr:hypothetical protein [Pseudomonadota bacterium]
MFWLMILGCADPGRSDAGLLLLDGEALDAGWLVEVEGEPLSTALPVQEGDAPILLAPDGLPEEFEFYPDEITLVSGPEGDVDWLVLGDDIATDAVEVVGDEATAADIAEQLGGPFDQVDSGIWLLEAPDILLELTWVAEPDGLYETLPLDDPGYVIASSPGDSGTFSERLVDLERGVDALAEGGSTRPAARGLHDRLETEASAIQQRPQPWLWVGAWDLDGRCVILDAVGGVDDCRGQHLGTWSLDDAQPTLSFQLDSAEGAWSLVEAP